MAKFELMWERMTYCQCYSYIYNQNRISRLIVIKSDGNVTQRLLILYALSVKASTTVFPLVGARPQINAAL